MSVAFHPLRVVAVERETADCTSLELEPPADVAPLFAYRAGQHLTFALDIDGEGIRRCYSLYGCPETNDPLRIAVKRVENGRASNWLNERVAPGDTLQASPPEGRFVLDPTTRATSPLFLFAAGSGITPIFGLLQTALATTQRSVVLLYANRDASATIFKSALDTIAAAHPRRLRVHDHFDADAGYVTEPQVRALLHDVDIAEFYICGPEPFMELVERTVEDAGAHRELMYIERFASPAEPSVALAAPDLEAAPASFSLWLNGRSRTVPYTPGQTLLECAREAGMAPPHSCESGYCGSCMAQVKTGAVTMRTHEALSPRDVERGVALLCQSLPSSSDPLELDADSTSFRAPSAVKSSYGRFTSRLAAVAVFAFMIAGILVLRWTR